MAKPKPHGEKSLASQKKVTAENLATLGVDRLAEILVEVAETRTDLKRRLRMALAAGAGAGLATGFDLSPSRVRDAVVAVMSEARDPATL